MWSLLFSKKCRIRSTDKAENERKKLGDDLCFYKALQETGLPARYEELRSRIESNEFKRRKRILRRFTWKHKPAEEKWKNSKERGEWLEYKQLKNDADILRYYALKKNSEFHAYRQWVSVFEDDFNGLYLDTSKWITRYYAGERLLKDTYGVGNDVQLFMPTNVLQQEQHLSLEFRQETVWGKYWDSHMGIVAKEYKYTSGIVSTALSFRQRLGRFEAKIKVCDSLVEQYFWLSGDGTEVHVNVMKFGRNGYEATYFTEGKEKVVARSGKSFCLKPGWYIFTFEWTAGEWVWKINDCRVGIVKGVVPDTTPALYAGFSVRASENVLVKHLPVVMQIEWVRFYVINNLD